MGYKPELTIGMKKNKLTLLSDSWREDRGSYKITVANFLCDCGVIKKRNVTFFMNGSLHSCGCFKEESKLLRSKTHGESKFIEHRIWRKMRVRCKGNDSRYGGRGISVCKRWDKYENFLKDMGRRPSSGHSIDRIDNNGNYCPENCRWATVKEQCNNRRSNVIVTYLGKTKRLSEWCEELGLPAKRCRARLSYGWSPEKVFKYPVMKSRKKICY